MLKMIQGFNMLFNIQQENYKVNLLFCPSRKQTLPKLSRSKKCIIGKFA